MSKTTRATIALDRAGVAYALHEYDYDPNAERIGVHAAESLGVPAEIVLKTLMALVDGKPVCLLIPSDREAGMKKVAAAFRGKSAAMMRPAEAERLTGYHVGGISPFGQKTRGAGRARRGGDRPAARLPQWRPARLADRAAPRRPRRRAEADRRGADGLAARRQRMPSSTIVSCVTVAVSWSSSVRRVVFQLPRANQQSETMATAMLVAGNDHHKPRAASAVCFDST